MDVTYYKEKYEPIGGKWILNEVLGEGSYGKVFRITSTDIRGKVSEAALKVITIPKLETEIDTIRETLQDEESVHQYFTSMVEKISEEFDLMAQLKGNTNIVSYEDHDIYPHANGIGYDILLRMELLKPLNKIRETLSEKDVIKIGIDICKALEVCQKFDIVHRDIKPENIFVSALGDYKLGDFGVAKTMKNELTVMTTTGTYSYMAPELKKGEKCSSNVDIYSLGMVMYRLLNFNRDPFLPLPPANFTFDQREQSLIRRMKGEALPNPVNASPELSKIILKACEYDPVKRYGKAADLKNDLIALLAKETSNVTLNGNEAPAPVNVPPATEKDETVGLFSNSAPQAAAANQAEPEAEKDETVGLFSNSVPQAAAAKQPEPEAEKDETVGLFSNSVPQAAAAKQAEPEAEKDETVGLFSNSVPQDAAANQAEKKELVSKEKESAKSEISSKSFGTLLFFLLFPYTGWFGIYNFYLGNVGLGFLKMCTVNFCFVGWIIDIVKALRGKLVDRNGLPVRPSK